MPNAIAFTSWAPRACNRARPRFRACALTHSAVAARSWWISFALSVSSRLRQAAIAPLSLGIGSRRFLLGSSGSGAGTYAVVPAPAPCPGGGQNPAGQGLAGADTGPPLDPARQGTGQPHVAAGRYHAHRRNHHPAGGGGGRGVAGGPAA